MDISVFEVVGPKMMGPSSSATAGMARIGSTAHKFLTGPLKSIDVKFVPARADGYFACRSHLGLIGGTMGIPADDTRLVQAMDIAKEQGIELSVSVFDEPAPAMPLTVQITAEMKNGDVSTVRGVSVGGGSIAIEEIDGFKVQPAPTEAHLFVWSDKNIEAEIKAALPGSEPQFDQKEGKYLFCVGVSPKITEAEQDKVKKIAGITRVQYIEPFIPLGYVPHEPLFTSYEQLEKMSKDTGKSIAELAIDYEIGRSGRTREEIWDNMADFLEVMKNSAKAGVTEDIVPLYGYQVGDCGKKMMKAYEQGVTLGGTILPKAIATAVGIMEYSMSCHCIIAAPTGGSSGIVPGCILTVRDEHGYTDKQLIESLFVAAIIGVVMYYHNVSFSGSNGGCQGEVGVSSAMAAAALVYLGGGNSHQVIEGSTLAMKHILGLLCDPIPGCPEVPCIKRNGIGVGNAFSGADMALSGVESFIPPDEVIDSLAHLQEKIFRGEMRRIRNTEGLGAAWTKTGKESMKRSVELCQNILLPRKK